MRRNRLTSAIFPRRILNYASVWERFGAFVIDLLIVMLTAFLIGSKIPVPFTLIITAWLYEAFQVSGTRQATLGQRTMGIKVSNVQGGSLDFVEASLRHFSKYISLVTALSGYLIIILDKRKQTLHDKIAESYVVTEQSYQPAV